MESLKTGGEICSLYLARTLSAHCRVATPLPRAIGECLQLAARRREVGIKDLEGGHRLCVDCRGCSGTQRLHGCDLRFCDGDFRCDALYVSRQRRRLSINTGVCPLGRFTGFTSHLKGTSCYVKFGAGKPQAFSTSMSLFVGVAQLFADGVQLTRYRRKLPTNAHTSRGDPGAACGSKCGDSLDRFGQQLFATGLLLRQRREATLLWAEGAENLLDTGPIVDCLFHLGFRSCAASLVARGAGELLNECAALLCLQA